MPVKESVRSWRGREVPRNESFGYTEFGEVELEGMVQGGSGPRGAAGEDEGDKGEVGGEASGSCEFEEACRVLLFVT